MTLGLPYAFGLGMMATIETNRGVDGDESSIHH